MSALDELREQEPGGEFLDLLQRTIRAVAVARNFPPPEGRGAWDETSVALTVADFFAHSSTRRRLTDLATHCRTDQALKRRLQKTIQNFLADGGRRTPVGRLVLRINEVLQGDDRFERRGRRWALVAMDDRDASVDFDVLLAAAAPVEVAVPAAWSTGDRQSPDIDAPSVLRVAHAVLTQAGGPLSAGLLAQVTASRLGIGGAPLSIDAVALDPPETYIATPDSTGNTAVLAIRAAEVFSLLNDRERMAVGRPALSVAQLGPVLGVGSSAAALVRKRAVTILRDELKDEEDGQAIADAVLDLARTWAESWMNSIDPTY